ncbi:hypothetical protein FZEAL_9833 [Fusarium zealandicum]|uniref:Sterol uptake control protein 2 n=1 Tax=Fusarium zealandicum TaxID=1053134 RepID=A0A8H4U8L1_9HYPO|nr:hypothetical protein FZEAL_9833 [Fusarium zealandicum]
MHGTHLTRQNEDHPQAEQKRSPYHTDSWANSPAQSPDLFPYFAKFVTGEPVEQSTWLTDLELMHHYTSSTFLTMPRAHELQPLWQLEVPKLALSHVFLLHQLLSVSAYHLTYLHPDRPNLPICASQHQSKAVVGLRSALATINEESCQEVFLGSSLLSICAFASFAAREGEQRRLDDLLDVFLLVRGMRDIINSYTDVLMNSRVKSMFVKGAPDEPAPALNAMIEQLQQLKIPDAFEPDDVSLCRESIASIIAWTEKSMATTNTPELRIAMSWSLSVSAEFLDLVRLRHPVALSILAHYCVILDRAGLTHWYIRGWGKSVLSDITDSIDPNWRVLLDWPLMATEAMARETGQ